jgi:CheY-like chemotaxis protein/HPt (histidine-containing phosphotransfer) domain-containing protein
MSHEIRTPMAAIIGYADLMLDPNQGPSGYQNGLHGIRRNGQHLLEVINDVLDLSKIEAGGMTVERISTELPRLAAEATSITRPKALEKGLTLSLEFSTPVPRTGLTDPLRLRQVLVNLIGNAIKFTEKGNIVLRVSCDGPSETDAVMKFEIIDTGVGMTPEELSRLFKVFSQADVSTTRRFGGSGLGLVISRRFARMLGGDIKVISQPGKGSTFTLDVRVGPVHTGELVDGSTEAGKAESTAQTYIASAETLRGVRILLADDGIDNRIILSAYLTGAGAMVDLAEDGSTAVSATVRSIDGANPYTIVLMDMQMPVLDGYGASSELRRRGYRGPIVALTARAMSDDRAKCIGAGCTDYMSKPVDRLALISLVAGHVGRGVSTFRRKRPIRTAVSLAETNDANGDSSVGPLRSPLADDPQFAEVLIGFVSRLPGTVADLGRLRRADDSKDLELIAHKLRGAAGSYGFNRISGAAGLVEDKLLAGEPVPAVAADVEALIALIRRVDGYDPAAEAGSPRVLAIAG